MFKSQSQQDKKKAKPKKEATSYYYDDDSLNLDLPTVNKFARLKVTVPLTKNKARANYQGTRRAERGIQ